MSHEPAGPAPRPPLPPADRPERRASWPGCGRSTWGWSTPSWAATASSASRRWPPTRPARRSRSSCRASARPWRPPARRERRRSRRCAATSPTASRTARRRCRRRSAAEVPIASGDERRRRRAAARRRRAGRRGGRVPAPRGGRLADRGRRRGGARGGRAEPARLVPGGAARARRPRGRRGRAPRGAARLRPRRAAPSRCAPSSPPTARATSWRRSPRTHPGALAQHMDGPRVRAAAAVGGDDAPEATLGRAAAARRAAAPPRHVGLSSFYARPGRAGARDPGGRARARRPAPVGRADRARTSGPGTYRLLFRVLASHPEEVRSFYEDTVAPVVRYDDQYRDRPRRDARGLPRAQLQHERDGGGDLRPPPHGRLPARAGAGAHGPRPVLSEDRERLGLGLKAYRIIAPRLPR